MNSNFDNAVDIFTSGMLSKLDKKIAVHLDPDKKSSEKREYTYFRDRFGSPIYEGERKV